MKLIKKIEAVVRASATEEKKLLPLKLIRLVKHNSFASVSLVQILIRSVVNSHWSQRTMFFDCLCISFYLRKLLFLLNN